MRSSLLGGVVVAELDGSGAGRKACVYAGGDKIAEHTSGSSVSWRHQNPGNTSWVTTYADRTGKRDEMDPLGAEVGTYDPNPVNEDYHDIKGDGQLYLEGGDPFDYTGGCDLDGIPISCNELIRRIGNGAVETQTIYGTGRAAYLGGGLIVYEKIIGKETDVMEYKYLQERNAHKVSRETIKRIINNTVEDTVAILNQSSDCSKAIDRLGDRTEIEYIGKDAVPVKLPSPAGLLTYLHQKGRVEYNNLPSSEETQSSTWSRGHRAEIFLAKFMFGNAPPVDFSGSTKYRTVSPQAYRVLTLLHELAHATGRYADKTGKLFGHDQVIDEGTLNDIVIENCYKAVRDYFAKQEIPKATGE